MAATAGGGAGVGPAGGLLRAAALAGAARVGVLAGDHLP